MRQRLIPENNDLQAGRWARLFCKGRPLLWLPPPIFFWSCPKDCARRRVSEANRCLRRLLGRRQMGRGRSKRKNAETNRRPKWASCSRVRGRANRSGSRRRPRRPCAVPRWSKDCLPASDGAADGVMDGFDLLLFPRVTLRCALACRLLMGFPSGCRGEFNIRLLLFLRLRAFPFGEGGICPANDE